MRRLIVALAVAALPSTMALAVQAPVVEPTRPGTGPHAECVPTKGNPTLEEAERESEPPPLPNGQPSPPSKPLCPPGQVLIFEGDGRNHHYGGPPRRVGILGHVSLSPPHHAPIHRSVEVSIFYYGYYLTSLRTKSDGSFFMRRRFPGDYYFRVKPTRKPYCHTTAVVINGGRGQRVPVRISVPTSREHRCGSGV